VDTSLENTRTARDAHIDTHAQPWSCYLYNSNSNGSISIAIRPIEAHHIISLYSLMVSERFPRITVEMENASAEVGFLSQMPFLTPNQQCQSTEGRLKLNAVV